MIRTGYLRWEIEVQDVRSRDDARSREVIFLARPSFRIVRVKRTGHADAAERFVRGEATYDSVLRTLDRDGGETDVRVPDVGPRPFRYSESDRARHAALLDGEAPARGGRLRARGRAHGGLVPAAGDLEPGPAGRLRPAGRRGRSSGSSRARASPSRPSEDEPMRLDAPATSRACPSWSPPSWSATWSSPRNSTSSASSTA